MSTGGLLVFITTRALNEGAEAPVNFIAGRCGKLDRVCSSSLAVESYAMVGGVACLEWTMAAYGELSNAAYDSTFIRDKVLQWDASRPLQAHNLCLDGVLICRSDADRIAITDATSLYDALKKQAKGKEPRLALAAGE